MCQQRSRSDIRKNFLTEQIGQALERAAQGGVTISGNVQKTSRVMWFSGHGDKWSKVGIDDLEGHFPP